MHDADAAPFQALRTSMETEWTPLMMEVLGLDAVSLPSIWDADLLYGPRTEAGEDTYVLCEINVSSVFAIPEQAPAAIARLTQERLRQSPRQVSPQPAIPTGVGALSNPLKALRDRFWPPPPEFVTSRSAWKAAMLCSRSSRPNFN
jgi:hypothetical protein